MSKPSQVVVHRVAYLLCSSLISRLTLQVLPVLSYLPFHLESLDLSLVNYNLDPFHYATRRKRSKRKNMLMI